MTRRTALVMVALTVAAVGCASNNKVGNSNLLNIKQKTSGGFDATTTTLAIRGTLPPAASTVAPPTTKATTNHQPTRTTTTLSQQQQQAVTAQIKIEGAGASAFTPSFQEVYPGTPVKWTNTDTVPRSVVADDGVTFNSGPIAPGASYTWVTTGGSRKIPYHDGTRPYAVGEIQVVPSP